MLFLGEEVADFCYFCAKVVPKEEKLFLGEEVADFCYFCAKVVPKEENQD